KLEELVSLLKKQSCVPWLYKRATSMKDTSDPIRKQLYVRLLKKTDTPDAMWERKNEELHEKLEGLLDKASDCRGVVKHLFEDSEGRSWEARLH
ncbi:MAG: hypothetical protein Q9180_008384, partial [Flavoplaca navasiana]